MSDQWGADVPVSLPQPLPQDSPGLVPMGGFTMTRYGLFPDLSEADHERLSHPFYAPYEPVHVEETVPEDEEDPWPTGARG